jgi:hypothetical protein
MPQAEKPSTTPSLPGANSTRTDGGVASKQAQRYISGMPNYGDGQELANLQAQAPLSATNMQGQKMTPSQIAQAASNGQTQAQQAQMNVTPLSAPTQRPNEPVTAGSPLGAGPGPEALGINPSQTMQGGQSAKNLVQTLASHPDASPELQQLASALGK